MTTPLRDRAEHAAKYDANLVVPARDIKDLLDQLDKAETARDDARSEARALAEELDRARLAESLHLEHVAALNRIRQIHQGIDAIHEPTGKRRQVCTGCGTDNGGWQTWPCPTIRAIENATALAENGDPR